MIHGKLWGRAGRGGLVHCASPPTSRRRSPHYCILCSTAQGHAARERPFFVVFVVGVGLWNGLLYVCVWKG